jgi:hypothetical protein
MPEEIIKPPQDLETSNIPHEVVSETALAQEENIATDSSHGVANIPEALPAEQSQVYTDATQQDYAQTSVLAQPSNLNRQRKHRKLALFSLGALVLLVNVTMLTGNVYLSNTIKTAKVVPATTVHNNVSSASVERTKSAPSAQPTTLHYVSTALNLEFDYPIDWRVTAAADSSNINLSSGKINFTDYSGVNKSGTISVTIQAKPTDPADTTFSGQYFSGSELIPADSTVLSYLHPTSVQRKSTHLSYVQDQTFADPGSDTTNPNAIDLLLVTGNVAFNKGQTIADHPLNSVDPQISAYINSCPDISCHYRAVAAVTEPTWQKNPNLSKIQDLIVSIRITK